jgi:transcriptional regulator with XRE-family HTH domain
MNKLPDDLNPFDDLERTGEDRRLMKQEQLLTRVAVQADRLREQLGITRTELARRLGTTKGNVTQILRGDRNLSLRKLSDLFYALECSAAVLPAPLDVDTVSILNTRLERFAGNELGLAPMAPSTP